MLDFAIHHRRRDRVCNVAIQLRLQKSARYSFRCWDRICNVAIHLRLHHRPDLRRQKLAQRCSDLQYHGWDRTCNARLNPSPTRSSPGSPTSPLPGSPTPEACPMMPGSSSPGARPTPVEMPGPVDADRPPRPDLPKVPVTSPSCPDSTLLYELSKPRTPTPAY